jgi:cellulose biosynthesis protein BcsQ
VALTVTLLSVKGGVGKTAAAVNLAAQSAVGGLRTLVVDLDPQGGATYTLGVDDGVPGGARRIVAKRSSLARAVVATAWLDLDLVPADFSLRHLDLDLAEHERPRRRLGEVLEAVQQEYDLVFIDCAPGITLANESALRASTVALVPIVPAPLPVRAFEQLRDHVAETKKLRRVQTLGFASMVDRRKRTHRDVVEQLGAHPQMLRTAIPAAVAVEQMGARRAPLLGSGRPSAAAIAYRDLWRELQIRMMEHAAGRPPRSHAR